ncbi:MAG: phosphate ABC transporter substrate-binding protein PstS [Mangrovibacterium sp.]
MKRLLTLVFATALLGACSNSGNKTAEGGKTNIQLTAAGATFPLPFYNMVFKEYTAESGTQVTYGGIGSGGGVRSLKDQVVDFGATDGFLDDAQLSEMPGEVLHIPTCIGAVVIAYNLPGVDSLKLTNTLLEKIFMGEITKWDDTQLVANNPGLKLPATEITVVYRSDGSGTTQIFADFMCKISQKWASQIGGGKSLNWPVGMGAKGNPGVAGTISQTNGAIGYIGSEFAFAQKIAMAKVQNSAGNYVLPTIESISAAARGEIPADTRIMLTNSSDPASYPISGFTWIIFYKEQKYNNRTAEQAKQTVDLLNWLLGPKAQGDAEKVHYAPLPALTIEKAKAILATATYDGKPLL